jgi:hypothetical protein
MSHFNQAKTQGWRAVALFQDGEDRPLVLGRSSTQVRAGFRRAFFDLLDDKERDRVRAVFLQRWHGAADAGRWIQQTTLPIPTSDRTMRSA